MYHNLPTKSHDHPTRCSEPDLGLRFGGISEHEFEVHVLVQPKAKNVFLLLLGHTSLPSTTLQGWFF